MPFRLIVYPGLSKSTCFQLMHWYCILLAELFAFCCTCNNSVSMYGFLQASASLSQETEKYTSQPLYQTNPHISEPLIPKKIEIAQVSYCKQFRNFIEKGNTSQIRIDYDLFLLISDLWSILVF